jgi:hypothetical protein
MVIYSHSIVRNIQPSIHSFLLCLCLSILLLQGCSTENKVEEDKMVLIYTDLLIAQDTTFVNETNLDSLISSVLKRYDVSEDEYEKTIEYYNENIKRWEGFFDKVTAHIESLSKSSP